MGLFLNMQKLVVDIYKSRVVPVEIYKFRVV